MGEILEFILEIIGEIFVEGIGETISSRYIPKWVRILVLSLVIGLILLFIIIICDGNETGLLIFGGIAVIIWMIGIYKIIKSQTSKYETVVLDEQTSFTGKRNFLGEIRGTLTLKNITTYVPDNKTINIRFSKAEDFEKKRPVTLAERESSFLKWIYNLTDSEFSYIVNQGRTKLLEKNSKSTSINNGMGLYLDSIHFFEDEHRDTKGIRLTYTFKDNNSNKSIWYEERKKFS